MNIGEPYVILVKIEFLSMNIFLFKSHGELYNLRKIRIVERLNKVVTSPIIRLVSCVYIYICNFNIS